MFLCSMARSWFRDESMMRSLGWSDGRRMLVGARILRVMAGSTALSNWRDSRDSKNRDNNIRTTRLGMGPAGCAAKRAHQYQNSSVCSENQSNRSNEHDRHAKHTGHATNPPECRGGASPTLLVLGQYRIGHCEQLVVAVIKQLVEAIVDRVVD